MKIHNGVHEVGVTFDNGAPEVGQEGLSGLGGPLMGNIFRARGEGRCGSGWARILCREGKYGSAVSLGRILARTGDYVFLNGLLYEALRGARPYNCEH